MRHPGRMPTDASTPATLGRPSKGADFYRRLFDEQERSRISVKKIAERENIPYTTLMYWRTRFRRDEERLTKSNAPQMLPVKIKAPEAKAKANPFELQTPSGFTLRIPSDFCLSTLQRILEALKSTC
jgi:transposase-like protein